MNIAILSGKGGTGKTTLATNLFYKIDYSALVDTDVEEPNAHLFLSLENEWTESVNKLYPHIDEEKCQLCGACGDFCRYNALLPARNGVLVHKELCHDCGGCQLVCPNHAISYNDRPIGQIIKAKAFRHQDFYSGAMNIGEVSGVGIIKSLRNYTANEALVIIDAPPGTSCATVEAIEGVDYCIIVTEPTPFGLSDMEMVIEMLNRMNLPFGVVINKDGIGDEGVKIYCECNQYALLGSIPFAREYAEAYSRGQIISQVSPTYSRYIDQIVKHLPIEISKGVEHE